MRKARANSAICFASVGGMSHVSVRSSPSDTCPPRLAEAWGTSRTPRSYIVSKSFARCIAAALPEALALAYPRKAPHIASDIGFAARSPATSCSAHRCANASRPPATAASAKPLCSSRRSMFLKTEIGMGMGTVGCAGYESAAKVTAILLTLIVPQPDGDIKRSGKACSPVQGGCRRRCR